MTAVTSRRPALPGWLPVSRLATAVLATTVVVSCRFLLPKPTPNGIVLDGAVGGLRNALIAAGIILVYRSTRIINFAQLALGVVGAQVLFNLSGVGIEGVGRLPFALSFVLAIVISLLFGLLIELAFVRRFYDAPRLVLTVVTVVAAPTIAGLAGQVGALPVWRRGQDVLELRSRGTYTGPFSSLSFEVFPITFGFGEVLTIVLAAGSFAGMALFFARSRLGAAVRGAAENGERALLLGINVKLLSTFTWAVAALFSSFAAIGQGLDSGFTGGGGGPEDLLPPLAAVVLGRLRSLPQTAVAAVVVGIVRSSIDWSFPGSIAFDSLMLLVVVVGLYLERSAYSRVDTRATTWRATQEIRPTPKELLDVAGLRLLRRGLVLAGAVVVVVFPLATSANQSALASRIAVNVIVALSLVVLTGWGGQVSLGQFALVGVGALVGGQLTADVGLSFWLALPLAATITGAVAAAIGQPALRIRGPFLAVTTLAFAVAVERVVFGSSLFEWLHPDGSIERPALLFVSFASERNYYYLCLAMAVASAVVVRRLRAGRPGRVLIAIREDEFGVQPFGISAGRSRVAVFALAGVLAGAAGVLLAHQQRDVLEGYTAAASIDAFVLVMIGGVSSVSGAVLGAVYTGVTGFLLDDPQVQRLANSGGLLFLLFLAPGGLASVAYGARDAVLRVVATRRRLAVPSLFADVDPEALARQKTQLGERIDGHGLDALRGMQRYRLGSSLYPMNERRPAPVPGTPR